MELWYSLHSGNDLVETEKLVFVGEKKDTHGGGLGLQEEYSEQICNRHEHSVPAPMAGYCSFLNKRERNTKENDWDFRKQPH